MNAPIKSHEGECLIVGVHLNKVSTTDFERSLRELEKLVDTLGYKVSRTLVQRRSSLRAATIVGTGKIDDIHRLLEDEPKIKCIAFDCEVSPTQQRNLENEFSIEIFDRTTVILEIFSRRAQTREARLQCELARLHYLSPRLRMTQQLDRQAGGIGGKGIGETQHELNKRRIRNRIAELNRLLKKIRVTHKTRRSRRSKEIGAVLFGYTNAGKSSLMTKLTGSDIYVEDKLFATLDTKIRALKSSPTILIADTVGIIDNIPHTLIASFYSTLDEVRQTDLVLHIVDASDEDWLKQLEVGLKILQDLDVHGNVYQLVFNKTDCLSPAEIKRLRIRYSQALMVSAMDKDSMVRFQRLLTLFFEQEFTQGKLNVPYEQGELIAEIYKECKVVSEKYHKDGIEFVVETMPGVLANIQQRIEK